eukprot:CAMPEP_0196695006 /NCGR_PEP_ID=MMETSP1090-20130531/35520_1 /TAXON_ID=37098 /ORGANISM="Isochrysis sp, Strain CCMP1244" /LENGTH=204 /DNA_ID=CAMNT_0042034523 /DNA_START=130 /DNA_END=745 /DNA_ORIENTATION=-
MKKAITLSPPALPLGAPVVLIAAVAAAAVAAVALRQPGRGVEPAAQLDGKEHLSELGGGVAAPGAVWEGKEVAAGRAVRRLVLKVPGGVAERRVHHDPRTPSVAEQRPELGTEEKVAEVIDLKLERPAVLGELGRSTAAEDARVAHEQVERRLLSAEPRSKPAHRGERGEVELLTSEAGGGALRLEVRRDPVPCARCTLRVAAR